jgi:hypothetical protein
MNHPKTCVPGGKAIKKIIYIIGTARSGTTLLDIILGNNPGFFSAGELNRFPRRDGFCPGLAVDHPTSLFWQKFREKLLNENPGLDLGKMRFITGRFEHHSGLFRIPFVFRGKSFNQYRDYISAFFNTLEKQVDDQVIIDSSKYPLRARHLSSILPNEIIYIHIKRNAGSVIKSFAKKGIEQPHKNWIRAGLYLSAVTALIHQAKSALSASHRVITINYENLVEHPGPTLDYLSAELNMSLDPVKEMIINGLPLTPGYLFDGNRIRLKEEIKLEKNSVLRNNSAI